MRYLKSLRLIPLPVAALVAVLLALGLPSVQAAPPAPKSVSGIVVDEANEPVIGASVREKGTQNAAVTDIEGRFTVRLSIGKPVIEISYVGYQTARRNITSSAPLTIKLVPSDLSLNEVVVVAYGKQKKVSLTGSVAALSSKELVKSAQPDLGAMLSGKLPGLTTIQTGGAPGEDNVTMFLRGAATTNGKSPLILVDGVPRDKMSDIDPNEVASISVLKDASSTAVFGVRGANGVILVTTRRGEEGKVNVHAQVSYSMQKLAFWPKRRHSYEYAALINEACDNDNMPHTYTDDDVAYYNMWRDGSGPSDYQMAYWYPDQDWTSVYLNDHTNMTQANVNITGGTKKIKYFTTAAYTHQGGIYKTESPSTLGYNPNSSMDRYNLRANIDYSVNKWISAKLDVSSYIKKWGSAACADGGNLALRINALTTKPTTPGPLAPAWAMAYDFSGAMNDDGTPVTHPVTAGEVVQDPERALPQSAYGQLNRSGYIQKQEAMVNAVGTVDFDLGFLTKGLSARAVLAFETYSLATTMATKTFSGYRYDLHPGGSDTPLMKPESLGEIDSHLSMGNSMLSRWFLNLQFLINYNRTFNDVHAVTAMLLAQRDEREDLYGSIPYKMIGTAGRFNYTFDSRYIAEVNIGYNGSEQFAKGHRFGFFPAFSLGWVLSNEAFFKPLYEKGIITNLKLRASLGKVGNDVLGSDRFLYLDNITNTTAGSLIWGDMINIPPSLNNNNIIVETLLGNKDIHWETSWKQNYGVDLSLLKQIDLTFDYFIEHRSDVLMSRNTVPYVGGLSSSQLPRSNFGKVDNRGFEVTGAWRYGLNKKVQITLNGNFSYNCNKVIDADEVYRGDDYAYPYRTTGYSLNQNWGYKIDRSVDLEHGRDGSGFFNTQEQIDASGLKYTAVGSGPLQPGDFIYCDLNDDGTIDDKDLCPIGYSSLLPRINYGFGATVNAFGFDLSMLFQGTGKFSRMYGGYLLYEEYDSKFFPDLVDNHRWTPEAYERGDKIVHPRLTATGSASHCANDYYIMDASYIRLKNLQVGYTIPSRITRKVGMNTVRVYFNADNLFTWTNLRTKLIDPEQADFIQYPLMKTYSFGVTVDL